jgi:hypothetical protein
MNQPKTRVKGWGLIRIIKNKIISSFYFLKIKQYHFRIFLKKNLNLISFRLYKSRVDLS